MAMWSTLYAVEKLFIQKHNRKTFFTIRGLKVSRWDIMTTIMSDNPKIKKLNKILKSK